MSMPPLVQKLEGRLLLHGEHGHLYESGLSAEDIFAAEIETIGFEHAHEHYLAAQSIERLGGAEVSNPLAGIERSGPESVGQWSTPATWPRVAVHATLLPTGKVLFWAYSDGLNLWDPVTNQLSNAAPAGYNIFCSGHSLLPDGRVLVTGGHIVNGNGLPFASIYNPFNNTWQRLPDMNNGRWYPTNTALANGDSLVVSGSFGVDPSVNNQLPQIWSMGGTSWRDLTGALRTLPLYPQMFLGPDGRVFFAGSSVTTRYLNTSGTGAWTTVGNRVFNSSRSYGAAVMYDEGKVLYVGGADPPTATAEVINLGAPAPAWRAVGSMHTQRRQINATILADGQVLVTGGVSGVGFNNTDTPVYTAELWNPQTEQFTTMASMARARWYHSTAMLLPDGRVLSSGGDNNASAEIFSPPYLFNGPRPTITTAPASIGYGQNFSITTPDAANITQAHLIRLSSVTHATNMDQRISRLSFTQVAGGLQLNAPTNPNLTPPGYYMLFIVNAQGVPSVAKMVQIAPAVSAEATVADASEVGPVDGRFTITRTGSTIGDMSFPYTITGTATNGVDYEMLSGVVTIANGQSSATITVTPIADDLMEGTETVVLTLETGSMHVVSSGAGSATIFIADTPPMVLGAQQVYATLPHELRFDFTRNVGASLSVDDILVQNLTTGQAVAPDAVSFDASVNQATFTFNAALPDGNYRATLSGTGIVDSLGTTLGADYTFDFHFLRGDANHDGQVNLADFNILAAHFGQSGPGIDFTKGDFNYDGIVNLQDFNILAARFGVVLAQGFSFSFGQTQFAGAEDDERRIVEI